MTKELMEMINSNPALFGAGLFYGVLGIMICRCISTLYELCALIFDKRRKLKQDKNNDIEVIK